MRSGRLRHRLQVQSLTEEQDVYGQPIKSWSAFKTVWGSIEHVKGSEIHIANQYKAEVTTKIRIRNLEGIQAKMRILHSGKIYNIEFINPVHEIRNEMELMCSEGVNDG